MNIDEWDPEERHASGQQQECGSQSLLDADRVEAYAEQNIFAAQRGININQKRCPYHAKM